MGAMEDDSRTNVQYICELAEGLGSISAAKDKADLIRLTRQWAAYDWQVLSQLRISGEFIWGSCGRRTAAPQGIRSTDPRLPGIGGP
jgi:hypothetical protein